MGCRLYSKKNGEYFFEVWTLTLYQNCQNETPLITSGQCSAFKLLGRSGIKF